MDSCTAWSPPEALPLESISPSDLLLLPTMDCPRQFCGSPSEEGAGLSLDILSSHDTIFTSSAHASESQFGMKIPIMDENGSLPSSSDAAICNNSGLAKRPKADEDGVPKVGDKTQTQMSQFQVKNIGEKITALQQLVSPYGKTDTASVLLEAIGYIKFLQAQVQVLSSPYIASRSVDKKVSESGSDLRSRGLCLVPVSCTRNVANSNGADFWISGIHGCSR